MTFALLCTIQILGAVFEVWPFQVLLIGVPVAVLMSWGQATTPNTKDWEQAFIQRMLAGEKDFWDAWHGSGIDLYRRSDNKGWPFER